MKSRAREGAHSPWTRIHTPGPTKGCVYAVIRIDGKLVYMHQLVWELFGTMKLQGDETIDHIDRNVLNNCISNLRPATKAMQRCNQQR